MKKLNLKPHILFLLISVALFAHAKNVDLNVKSKGRAPSRFLKIKASKVPQFELTQKNYVQARTGGGAKFELVKITNIPKLDVGEERSLEFNQNELLLSPAPLAQPPLEGMVKVEGVKLDKQLQSKIAKVIELTASSVQSIETPELKELKNIEIGELKTPKPEEKKIYNFTENEYKLIQGLIFFEIRKNNPLSLGIFSQLTKDPKVKSSATFQVGLTAYQLGLHSEFRAQMLKLVNEKDAEWRKFALIKLVEFLNKDGYMVVPIIDKALLQYEDLEIKDDINYNIIRARYYLDNKDLTNANDALTKVEVKAPKKPEYLFLKSLFLYNTGELDKALDTMRLAVVELENQDNLDLKSLSAITLARYYFQKNKFKEAYDTYSKVNKGHPLWLQSIIEQAWTQILVKDYEGAAGNMFSLHTDYFKGAFKPESYIVRTVAYLNLCQFGDSVKVLESMKRSYVPYVDRLDKFQKEAKAENIYYDTIKAWLKSPELKEVNGLPRAFIAELASHPSFLNLQKVINNLEDQNSSFLNITKDVVNLERTYTQKILETQDNIQKIETEYNKTKEKETAKRAELQKQIDQLKINLISYREQQTLVKASRNSLKELREISMDRIEKEKLEIRKDANKFLAIRYANLSSQLVALLDQSEVLQYEVYSGAGEHLRYQMAGGDVKDKPHQELKAEKDKSMRWSFKGEIWEDEIGHFRSSLKNVCPDDEDSK